MDWFRGLRFQVLEGEHQSLVRSFVERFGGSVAGEVSPPRALPTQSLVQDVANAVLTAELDGLMFVTSVGFVQTMRLWQLSQGVERTRQGLMDIEYLWGPGNLAAELAAMGVRRKIAILDGLASGGLGRDILKNLDGIQRVEYLQIALERTTIFPSLQAGLESRGCHVREIPVHGSSVGMPRQDMESDMQSISRPLFVFVFNDAELYDLRCWRTQIASESSRVCVLVENALLERNARQLGFEVASQFDCQRLFQHDAELAQELAARFW